MKASNNTGIIVLLGKGTPNCHVKLAVRNSVSTQLPIRHLEPSINTQLPQIFHVFWNLFASARVPVQHNSHTSYIRPGQYQVNVVYDPACSLTTNTAETMQHEEVAGAAPNGIVGTLRTPYLDGRSACQHNVWSVWTYPFCSLQLLSHNSYNYLLPKNR